jgi:hypothetical protein
MLAATYFIIAPLIYGFDSIWISYNTALTLAGIGIGFSTLQDTTKTQNEISRKVWEDPRKGKQFIAVTSVATLLFMTTGLAGLFVLDQSFIQELSYGLIIFALGMLGLLKAMLEMFENHRLDKN